MANRDIFANPVKVDDHKTNLATRHLADVINRLKLLAEETATATATATASELTVGHEFTANCSAGDAIGDFVEVTGETSSVPNVSKVDVTSPTTMPARGVISAKASPVLCTVLKKGELVTAGLIAGESYYVGASSTAVATAPVPGVGAAAVTQEIGVALTSTRLLLDVDSFHRIRRG